MDNVPKSHLINEDLSDKAFAWNASFRVSLEGTVRVKHVGRRKTAWHKVDVTHGTHTDCSACPSCMQHAPQKLHNQDFIAVLGWHASSERKWAGHNFKVTLVCPPRHQLTMWARWRCMHDSEIGFVSKVDSGQLELGC